MRQLAIPTLKREGARWTLRLKDPVDFGLDEPCTETEGSLESWVLLLLFLEPINPHFTLCGLHSEQGTFVHFIGAILCSVI
jgi:hypothetical protein